MSIVTIRAKAFSRNRRRSIVRVLVESDGACLVLDPISGHWTRCHALTEADMARAAMKVLS